MGGTSSWSLPQTHDGEEPPHGHRRKGDLWAEPTDLRRLCIFSQQLGHIRVDGARHPKSRPSPSALGGTATLLALVEVNVLQPLMILLTAASGRHALHGSPEATGGWDGQKANSCDQPVDAGLRAGHTGRTSFRHEPPEDGP